MTDEKLAELRNLFSPILHYFTVKEEKYKLLRIIGERNKLIALDKAELSLNKQIMSDDITNKIKNLLDEEG